MLRKWNVWPLLLAAGLVLSLGGCGSDDKAGAPQVKEKPPPNAPKPLPPGGAGGKRGGPGSASQ